ncbi:MAG: hypothetical protein CMG75_10125 [Candidatus Marinimicrobia bacterium]|nr:hypothetical protein [Candidatus Neomarinimicrobiota bacterium]
MCTNRLLLQSILSICFSTIFLGCESKIIKPKPIEWSVIDSVDIENINQDIEEGKATIDVGIYFPSNFDPDFNKVTLENIISGFLSAKEIYSPTSVQLKLLWIKTGIVDRRFLSLQANKIPEIPQTEYTNMYTHMKRHPSILTKQALDAFNSIIERNPDNHRTIYLIALQEVFLPFLEVSEGRNWMIKTVRTGGLSFPSYSYCNTIPKKLRGVITLTNLSRPDRLRRTIAHEIGHKAINVSHEYGEINPQHEIYDEGGLMIYGNGEEIPSGKKGRWHLERLMISPFIYRKDKNGNKIWNRYYEEGGHYYDPIYGNYTVMFKGSLEIDEDW